MSDKRKIDELIPDADNANLGTDRGRELLKQSLADFGAGRSILLDKEGRIIAGNKTVEGAREVGIDDVVIVRTTGNQLVAVQRDDLDLEDGDGRARRLAYADNRIAEVDLEWDVDQIVSDIENGMDIDDLFEELELPKVELIDTDLSSETEGLIDDDEIPDPEEEGTITKLGDLWILGEHRLLCGDATKPEDVERLMGGEKADMVFTDPPYALFGSSTGVVGITDDKMVRPFFRDVFRACRNNTKLYSHIYVCCDWHSAFSLEGVARELKLTAKNLCIWDKGDGGLGAMYQQCYEMVWFFANSPINTGTQPKKKIGKGERTINGKSNIWRHNRVVKNRKHNAQKPVEMMMNAVINSSDDGGKCIDFFLGSGSTLIACEKTGRRCYGMEIDPHYCDVIVNRWEQFTGEKAVLMSTNKKAQ